MVNIDHRLPTGAEKAESALPPMHPSRGAPPHRLRWAMDRRGRHRCPRRLRQGSAQVGAQRRALRRNRDPLPRTPTAGIEVGTERFGPPRGIENVQQNAAGKSLFDAGQADAHAIAGGCTADENDPPIGGITEDVAPKSRPFDDEFDDGAPPKLNG